MTTHSSKSPEYPEHDKLAAIKAESQLLGEFLSWLDERGIRLSHYNPLGSRRAGDDGLVEIGRSREELLAEYFEIDLRKLDDEKRDMLEQQQRLNRR